MADKAVLSQEAREEKKKNLQEAREEKNNGGQARVVPAHFYHCSRRTRSRKLLPVYRHVYLFLLSFFLLFISATAAAEHVLRNCCRCAAACTCVFLARVPPTISPLNSNAMIFLI
jgi:hypothetical protein